MRIFKNRGDIFFSKTDREKSAEQKFLLGALAFIILFTAVFVLALGIKYNFNIKEFFAPDEPVTQLTEQEEYMPAQVQGKDNFAVFVKDEKKLLFAVLVQVDMDNISYKVSALKADTLCNKKNLNEMITASTPENAKTGIEKLLNVKFDYYLSMEYSNFCEFYDMLGATNYPVISDIKFKDNDSVSPYSLKLKAGEQKISGKEAVALIRYYLDEKKNTSAANDFILSGLLQQINKDNVENAEELFQYFVMNAQTNITVRDFSLAQGNLSVLSDERTAASVYSADAQYDNTSLKKESMQSIKSYFSK